MRAIWTTSVAPAARATAMIEEAREAKKADDSAYPQKR